MNKYTNGKIYKISIKDCDKVYIGSTCRSLPSRFTSHLFAYKYWKENGTGSKFSLFELFDEFGISNAQIDLIEQYPCLTKNELVLRESEYIKKCENKINKNIPGRTMIQYYQDNKDKLHEYRIKNEKKTREYHNTKFICECGKELTMGNRARHMRSNYHINRTQKNGLLELII